jgi:hypothetical protein
MLYERKGELRMKITTTTTTLEGRPDELAAYQTQIAGPGTPPPAASVEPQDAPIAKEHREEAEESVKFVKLDLARRVLSRRPLSREQKIVLVSLYRAHPDKLTTLELQRATGYAARQMAGLMGAFGRRLTHTRGYEEGDRFFDWVWNDDGWHYGLPDSVREAMEFEKLV